MSNKIIKCDTWPIVLENDDGIRPAGHPDRCMYCNQRIGELHRADCVTVQKRVQYAVIVDGNQVGIFEILDPHGWTPYDCDFHKNESSWCADNATDSIQWTDDGKTNAVLESQADNQCSCAILGFKFLAVLDEGPFVEIRQEEEDATWVTD